MSSARERAHDRLDREMSGRWHIHSAAYDFALKLAEENERLREELEGVDTLPRSAEQ